MEKFTILKNFNSEIIKAIKETKFVDISLIPKSPMLFFYDNNDNLIHQSNNETDYAAIKLMIAVNDLKGYYFTVETEWWDDKGEYQGTSGGKNYKKYHFNCGEHHCNGEFPTELFMFPFDCLCATPD